MPRFIDPKGVGRYIPGAYLDTNVVRDSAGPLPDFLVPVVVGAATHARYPRGYRSSKQAIENERTPFVYCGTSSAAKAAFGDESDIAVGMRWAKLHGLPSAYVIAVNALTRATVLATSTGPVVQGTFFSKMFGAVGGHIKLKVASGTTVTVTPVHRYSMLTADASSGATRLYVRDASWLGPGLEIVVGDNDTADAAYVIDSVGTALSSTGQIVHYIELTTALAANITTAQYGMVLIYDSPETPDAFGDVQALADWCNTESKWLGFQPGNLFSNPAALIALATSTPLKEIAAWSTATAGTSPASVSGDHSSLISDLDATEWDAFIEAEALTPQAFLLLSSSATVHGLWRDWAVAKREEGSPVSVTTGVAWGDVVIGAGDDTAPEFRAAALNSQDVSLWAGGLDQTASYLSLAAAVFGRRIGGGVNHNLTSDDLIYSSVEYRWNERGAGELSLLHRRGVGTYRLGAGGRWRVSQGLSTLQTNSEAWNETDATTPLLMQRDLADYWSRGLKDLLETTQVGADEVTRESVAATIVALGAQFVRRGYITRYQIVKIVPSDEGNGWNAEVSIWPNKTTDFIGVTTNIRLE